MLTLITGGSKCGKSRMAETLAASYGPPLFYIATMEPYGPEAAAVIARHRSMRDGKDFVTVERYSAVGSAPVPRGCHVLLEDVGNLLANEMFSAKARNPAEAVVEGIAELNARCAGLIAVTNQVGGDGFAYPPETEEYIRLTGEVNRRLAAMAEVVIEAVCGLPLTLKGECPKCL